MDRLIFLDTETTGLYPDKGHRICEIAAIEYIDDKPTGYQFHTYLNPGREVDEGASKINGLTWDKLKNEPKFEEIYSNFANFITDATVIAHNAQFDIGFLDSEIKLVPADSSIAKLSRDILCTRALAKNLYPYDKLTLDALCGKFGIDISHRAIHGAMIDIKLLAKVYYKLREEGQRRHKVTEDKPI